eukprot:1163695-Alexandrium_andersonii.AAC.1
MHLCPNAPTSARGRPKNVGGPSSSARYQSASRARRSTMTTKSGRRPHAAAAEARRGARDHRHEGPPSRRHTARATSHRATS